MFAVAFFSDSQMLPGLHATLLSLLTSLDDRKDTKLELHLFLDKVNEREKQFLVDTHGLLPKNTELKLHDFSPVALVGSNSLHGNQTAYGRIYLSTLLPDCQRCVYLDSDLIVNRSIYELFEQFDDEHVVLADGTGTRSQSLDHALFKAAGLSLSGPCFNSGVLGINLKLWREKNVTAICQNTADKYAGMFLSADQALLNVALHDSFKVIGNDWNTPIYPHAETVRDRKSVIYHFVGSPKPWDIFGKYTVKNYQIWHEVYSQTSIGKKNYLAYSKTKRSLLISKSLLRLIWKKKRSGKLSKI